MTEPHETKPLVPLPQIYDLIGIETGNTITMKITLKKADQTPVVSLSDLEKLIPVGMSGEALGYGQGEGQLRIGRSVWGFYYNDARNYGFVLEEGVLSFEEVSAIAAGILDRFRSLWGSQIEGEVRGCHHDDPEMRLLSDSALSS